MKRLVKRFGKLMTASFFVMGIGVIVFLITPLSIWLWDADIDISGAFIFIIGAILCVVGSIRRVRSIKE
jgi:uncharacterized membrane protein YiaA